MGGLRVATKGGAEKPAQAPSWTWDWWSASCVMPGAVDKLSSPWAGQAGHYVNNLSCPHVRTAEAGEECSPSEGAEDGLAENTASPGTPLVESGNHSFLVISLVLAQDQVLLGCRLLERLLWGWHPQHSLFKAPLQKARSWFICVMRVL